MFLLQPLAAGYTPISLDRHGRLYAINAGDLFAIEGRRDEHRDHDDHGDD